VERVGDPATLGTLPICGVPCTPGAPGVEACPLPSSASAPRVSPYRGDQGAIPLLRSSSFSATGGGGGVIGSCAFGDQADALLCAGSLLEGGQAVGRVPPSGTQDCCSGELLMVAAVSVEIMSCMLPHFPQKREFAWRSAPQ
jgi:hypothetical protein